MFCVLEILTTEWQMLSAFRKRLKIEAGCWLLPIMATNYSSKHFSFCIINYFEIICIAISTPTNTVADPCMGLYEI